MRPSLRTVTAPASLEDLTLTRTPDGQQLENVKSHLDLILLALKSLAGIGSEAMLQAAAELNLESVIGDRVTLWRLRQSNPLRKSSGGRKKLDVEEARSLVLIVCHLAQGEQEKIRRACSLLEQVTEQGKEPHRAALLGDYLDNFSNTYQERMDEAEPVTPDFLVRLAFKLLIDLLFYGANNGHRRLWLALMDHATA